jgi:hypothetical protein
MLSRSRIFAAYTLAVATIMLLSATLKPRNLPLPKVSTSQEEHRTPVK